MACGCNAFQSCGINFPSSGALVCQPNAPAGTYWRIDASVSMAGGASAAVTFTVTGPGYLFSAVVNGVSPGFVHYLPVSAPNGVYTITATVTVGGVPCTGIVGSFTAYNYNNDNLQLLLQGYTDPFCGNDNGTITVIAPINSQNIYYIELWDAGGAGCISNCGTPTPGNTYTFTGLPPGNYEVRNYRVCPPAAMQAGQFACPTGSKTSCYAGLTIFLSDVCNLKLDSCDGLSTEILDPYVGTNAWFPTLQPSDVLNKVVKGIFGTGSTLKCWLVTGTTDPVTIFTPPIPPIYANCPACEGGGPCEMVLSAITVDESCNQGNGSIVITPAGGLAPYIFQWSPNISSTNTATNLSAGAYTITVIDSEDCQDTIVVTINNLPCVNYYLITPCDTTARSFVIKDPTTTPNPNPNTYVGNIFEGTITFANGNTMTGCFNMMPTQISSSITVSINVTLYSYPDCSYCEPPAWLITRCNDTNIFYLTNTDMSAAENQVINNLVISGCDANTFPCNTLEDQCWIISQGTRGSYPVVVQSYGTIYPDCECCKPC